MVRTKRRIASKPVSLALPVAADHWVAAGGVDPEMEQRAAQQNSIKQVIDPSALESQISTLLLDHINEREQDTRSLSSKHVESLSESIAVLGLIEPLVVDQSGNLLAGGHRLAAIRMLKRDRLQTYYQHFPDDCVPIRRLSFKVEEDPDLALQIEIAENEQRRDYTAMEIRAIADRLRRSGYAQLKGRPRQGQKALMPALAVVVGKHLRTIQRYLTDDLENDSPQKSTTSVVLLQQSLSKLKKWQQIPHETQQEQNLEKDLSELIQKIEDVLATTMTIS
jgi:ParB family chromosome partitioning protein